MVDKQDATALADRAYIAKLADMIEGKLPGVKVYGSLAVPSDEARATIVAALRPASAQTPDATKIATLEFELKAARYELETADGEIDRLQALSTPSASAGPQAEVIAWRWRYCRDEEIGRWIYNDDRPDLDCTKAMVELEALALAHTQPQQADGRGAVIEAQNEYIQLLQDYSASLFNIAYAHGYRCSNADIKRGADLREKIAALKAALQQSPATDEG